MNQNGLKEKLGLDVFKEDVDFHIKIRPGRENDPSLRQAALICPAGLYVQGDDGAVTLSTDGCLECGSCRLVCGYDVLDWHYPSGIAGVQFRFG
jgi:ferredoxin like protein